MNRWRQGEHVAVVGMTGSGKTTLLRSLLNDYRDWKIFMVSKPDDLTWKGWSHTRTAKGIDNRKNRAWLLEPEFEKQRQQFKEAFDKVWKEGGWCVAVDECYYIEHIGLQNELIKDLTQGRAKRISVVVGIQRPARVTRFALSEPTHIFCFRSGDNRDIKTIGEMVGEGFAGQVSQLGKYEFAYLNKVTGEIRKGNSRDTNGVFDKNA